MKGRIESAKPSKSGKTLSVKIGDMYYQTKHWELQNEVGREIDAKTSESTYNGDVIHWLNEYQFTTDVQPAQSHQGVAPSPQGVDYRPLVSNLAAHLIAAQKDPEELRRWFNACKAILEPKEPDF